MDSLVSIVIPSRNEKYLDKTIKDIQRNARGNIEIIVSCDGYRPDPIEGVIYIYKDVPEGMRAGINSCVAIAKGQYILKTDAHCMFAEGFDLELVKSAEPQTVIVPRRYRLNPEKWEIIEDGRPPIDRMSLSEDLHGKDWQKGNTDALIEETPSSQGSCWFMPKEYFYELELMDQKTYGTFWSEFQEIGLKCWLSGGRVLVNKKTWYAHWHKDERGYRLNEKNTMTSFTWHKATRPLSWLFEHFK
jgi:glycosyltransferase involved in cell wall biosynthesis